MDSSDDVELQNLRKENDQLDAMIQSLQKEGFKQEELAEHIKKLHEYNEIKDVAQTVLGKIAEQKCVTTAALYNEYGLELTD